MKINILSWLVYISIFTLIFSMSACSEEDPVCMGNEALIDGKCQCLDGFSGELCMKEDSCITQDVTCLNDGVCDGGKCECREEWAGKDCSVAWKRELPGEYKVLEFSNFKDDPIYEYDLFTRFEIAKISNFSNQWYFIPAEHEHPIVIYFTHFRESTWISSFFKGFATEGVKVGFISEYTVYSGSSTQIVKFISPDCIMQGDTLYCHVEFRYRKMDGKVRTYTDMRANMTAVKL